jgi:hypothetical protein
MLTKGMFGHEFSPESPRFGIYCGQMRWPDYIHNGGWYNGQGQKIGRGDLTIEDMERICRELQPDEAFIILSESDSFWQHVRRPGVIGNLADVDQQTDEEPGIEYIALNAMYIIKPGQMYHVDRQRHNRPADYKPFSGRDIVFRGITPRQATDLLGEVKVAEAAIAV